MSEPKNPEIEHFVAPFEETPVAAVDAVKVSDKKQNLWTDAWNDMRRRPMFWISAAIILLVVVVSLFPTLFTQVDPRACQLSLSNQGPAAGHPLFRRRDLNAVGPWPAPGGFRPCGARA